MTWSRSWSGVAESTSEGRITSRAGTIHPSRGQKVCRAIASPERHGEGHQQHGGLAGGDPGSDDGELAAALLGR